MSINWQANWNKIDLHRWQMVIIRQCKGIHNVQAPLYNTKYLIKLTTNTPDNPVTSSVLVSHTTHFTHIHLSVEEWKNIYMIFNGWSTNVLWKERWGLLLKAMKEILESPKLKVKMKIYQANSVQITTVPSWHRLMISYLSNSICGSDDNRQEPLTQISSN